MPVDQATGQSVIPIPGFDQKYAAFVDPSTMGNLAAQQQQLAQQTQLGQAMMQRGYIPNSGWGGALAQMGQALAGMRMLQSARDNAASVNQQLLAAAQQAAKAQHDQAQKDKVFDVDQAIRQATGIKQGEEDIKLKNADQEAANEAKAAALKAQAELPTQMALEKQKGGYQIEAANISANAANRRGYVVQDASGNQQVVSPQGQVIYQTTTPGGGKLTPTQTALNAVDEEKAKQLQVRGQAASQLSNNLTNWASQYTGQDMTGKSPQDVAKAIQGVSLGQAAMTRLNPNMGGLDAISNDIGINAAGTKRPTPTDAIIAAEQANTMSRSNTPAKNAQIYLNHISDIHALSKDIEDTTNQIKSRQSPGSGSVPQAQPGPTNPAPVQNAGITHVWTPDAGLQQVSGIDPSKGMQ